VSDRKNWLTALLLGGIGGLILWKKLNPFRRDEDERPPIRVRGGSIQFQNDYGWHEHGGEWKTRQSGAKPVRYFTVTVNGEPCGISKGPQLNITYETTTGKEEVFKVVHRGGDPRILPGGLLKQDDFHFDAIVHDPGGKGRVTKISAPPNPQNECELSGNPYIVIGYEYEED
jgi:hypothetical protein